MKYFHFFIGLMVLNTLPLFGGDVREIHILPRQTIAQRILPLQNRFLLTNNIMDRMFAYILSYPEQAQHTIADIILEKNLDAMMRFVDQLYNPTDYDMQSEAEEDEVLDEPMDEEKGSEEDFEVDITFDPHANQQFQERLTQQEELLAIDHAVRREQQEADQERRDMQEGEFVSDGVQE